jgi:hypothetical protein
MTSQPSSVPPTPQGQPSERRALGRLTWFAIIQLVGSVGGGVASIYLFFNSAFWGGFASKLGPNPTSAQVAAALDPLFRDIAYSIVFGIAVSIVALLFLTFSLRDLAKVDRTKFSVPSTLMLLDLAGVILVAAAVYPFFTSISSVIAQAPGVSGGTPSQAFFSAFSSLFLYIGLMGLGGVLVLIGAIGGLILGLWRVGEKYDQTIIKVGAIFFIVPLLNLVAPVLVLVGAWEAKNRLTGP